MKNKISKHPQKKTTTLVYEFLLEHGAMTPFQIARTLNLDQTAVRDVLKKLQKKREDTHRLSSEIAKTSSAPMGSD